MRVCASITAAVLGALLLAGCSSASDAVRSNIPAKCAQLYEASEDLLDLMAKFQDEALGRSDDLFEFTEALGDLDADRVEKLALEVSSRAHSADVERVRALVADYRVGVKSCRG